MTSQRPSLPSAGAWQRRMIDVGEEVHAGKQSRVFDARLDIDVAGDAELLGWNLARLHDKKSRLGPFEIPPVAALESTGRAAVRSNWQLLHGGVSDQNGLAAPTMLRIFDVDDCGYGPIEFDVANSLYKKTSVGVGVLIDLRHGSTFGVLHDASARRLLQAGVTDRHQDGRGHRGSGDMGSRDMGSRDMGSRDMGRGSAESHPSGTFGIDVLAATTDEMAVAPGRDVCASSG